MTRRRRIALVAFAYVACGAIVSVLVAWWIVLDTPLDGEAPETRGHPLLDLRPEGLEFERLVRRETPGMTYVGGSHKAGAPQRPTPDTGSSPASGDSAAALPRVVGSTPTITMGRFYSAGWPLRCVTGASFFAEGGDLGLPGERRASALRGAIPALQLQPQWTLPRDHVYPNVLPIRPILGGLLVNAAFFGALLWALARVYRGLLRLAAMLARRWISWRRARGRGRGQQDAADPARKPAGSGASSLSSLARVLLGALARAIVIGAVLSLISGVLWPLHRISRSDWDYLPWAGNLKSIVYRGFLVIDPWITTNSCLDTEAMDPAVAFGFPFAATTGGPGPRTRVGTSRFDFDPARAEVQVRPSQSPKLFVTVPLVPWVPGILANLACWTTVAIAGIIGARFTRRLWRRRMDRCTTCGYELVGLSTCPECGMGT